jgi:hypothetical protein
MRRLHDHEETRGVTIIVAMETSRHVSGRSDAKKEPEDLGLRIYRRYSLAIDSGLKRNYAGKQSGTQRSGAQNATGAPQ